MVLLSPPWCSAVMKLPFERDPSAFGDLAEGDEERCASGEDEQPHVQCVLGYFPTVIVVLIRSRKL